MLALLAATAPLSFSLSGGVWGGRVAAPRMHLPATMLLPDPAAADALSHLTRDVSSLIAAEAEAAPITPLLLAELSVAGGMCAGGNLLHTFGNVDEPKEEGMYAEGEVDIYRDSPLRYMGYVNEMGEAFRPLVPVEVVYLSYVAAIAYILADTLDKGVRGSKIPGPNANMRATFGAVDTFAWQMLASVIFPSFCINRLVTLIVAVQAGYAPFQLPDLLTAGWIATALGLGAIPLLITPLDVLAHWNLNGSFRKLSAKVLGESGEAPVAVKEKMGV